MKFITDFSCFYCNTDHSAILVGLSTATELVIKALCNNFNAKNVPLSADVSVLHTESKNSTFAGGKDCGSEIRTNCSEDKLEEGSINLFLF